MQLFSTDTIHGPLQWQNFRLRILCIAYSCKYNIILFFFQTDDITIRFRFSPSSDANWWFILSYFFIFLTLLSFSQYTKFVNESFAIVTVRE